MVSQSQNDEWETPSRNGSTLSLDYRQQPPAVRTPPSYFDAVRSRHSLSQPDAVKTEKPLSPQHVKYNSLPRPLPQRLQTCPPHIYDAQQAPRTGWLHGQPNKMSPENDFSRPADTNSGFQVYTRPPGPANHVPLSPRNQLLMISNSSSLPRCFPRDGGKLEIPTPNTPRNGGKMEIPAPNGPRNGGKLEMSPPNVPRDIHQPLSIIVKHDFNGPPMAKQGEYQKKMARPPNDETRFVAPPMRRTQPPLPPEPMKNHQPSMRHPAGHTNRPSRTNSLPRNQDHGNQAPMVQYKQENMPYKHQQCPTYHYPNATSYPRYSRSGTLPFQHPRRDYIVEPAICIRTGPLGSYPEPGQIQNNTLKDPPKALHTSKSQNLLECADMPPNQTHFSHIRRHEPPSVDLARPPPSPLKQSYSIPCSPPPRSLPPSSPLNHQSIMKNCMQQRNGSFHNQEYSLSSTLPRKKSRDKMLTDFSVPHLNDFTVEHSAVFQHPASTNGTQNSSKTFSPNKLHLGASLADQHYSQKLSDDDSHSSTPSKGISRETPEEAGLVMIVESRELNNRVNSVAKDLVKPTPRIPISPSYALPVSSSTVHNGIPMSLHREPPYSPPSNFNTQMYGYHNQIQTNGSLLKPHHISSEDINSPLSKNFGNREVFRAVPGNTRLVDAQPIKPQNGFLLRRTPLSSSTASLSSEISSVCSRSRKTQDIPQKKRIPSSRQKSLERNTSPDDKGKKNEISNSPWVREEKEELQKQQILGARRARDEEIAYLESQPDRTMKQEEWLRILRLEREFQRRAEEIDDDDDEDDEVLLERAEHRERMLMMQEENPNDVISKCRSSTQSSSDQWLANSQAKQPKRNKDNGGGFSLNGSFEIEHFNDLLETMNMSPVIRDDDDDEYDVHSSKLSPYPGEVPETTDVDNGSKYDSSGPRHETNGYADKSTYSQCQTKPVPAPRISKTVSPIPPCYDINISTRAGMNLCSPVENGSYGTSEAARNKSSSMRPLSENFNNSYEARKQEIVDMSRKTAQYNYSNGFSPHKSIETYKNNPTKAKVIPSSDIKVQDEQQYSKLALRIPLKSVGKEKDGEQNAKSNVTSSPTKQKEEETVFLKRISNGEPYLRSTQSNDFKCKEKFTSYKSDGRPVSDSNLGSLYSPTKFQNGMSKSLNNDLEGKSSEYKKIWNSRPEKLTFMDKIKKFSLQAGDDDLPKDKVKNSRAQRELEIKFNGELTKNVG